MIKKIGIFSNNDLYSKEIFNELVIKLKNKGYIIDNNDFDLAIAIGGDGSFLRMVRDCHFDSKIYYLGINTGTLGFAQELYPNEIDKFLLMLEDNSYKVENISIGEVNIVGNNLKLNFLNEVLIRDDKLKAVHLKLFVGDELLESFVGDGILLSTSFGSTAYNLSFNGSIVYSDLHVLQLTPIAPINNKKYRTLRNSVIIPEERKISIIPKNGSNNILVTCDGENYVYNDVQKLEVSVKKDKVKCLRMNNYDYTRRINEKFLKD